MYRRVMMLGVGVFVLAGVLSAQAALKHRYSFDNPAGDATGATVVDSISGSNGTVLGANAVFTGTTLDLPGGSSASAGYMDLPNGMISSLTAVTFEGWVTIDSTDQAWARLFDFGTTSEGEHTGPGGGGSGVNYLYLSAAVNANYNSHRFEMSAGVSDDIFTDAGTPTVVGEEYHFLVTVENDGEGGMIGRWWKNGVQIVFGDTADVELSAVQDVNNWLGRSNWTGDANLNGQFNEFRIYDHAMTPLEAQISYQLGPENTSGDAGAETSRTVEGDDTVVIEGTKRFLLALTFSNLPDPIIFSQDPDLTWSSSDTNVATVSQSGIVAGVGLGTATITANYPGAPATKDITVTDRGLRHQYSFNEPYDWDGGMGLPVADSIGGATGMVYYGTIQGDGTVLLESDFATYIDLPNGILSQYGAATVEAWFTPIEDSYGWSRIFSFGISTAGELDQDTITGDGAGQVFCTIDRGTTPLYSIDMVLGGTQRTIIDPQQHGYDELTLVTWTFNPVANQMALYVDGVPKGTSTAPYVLGDLQDVNAWIGRSQWSADGMMNGTVEEFRIYEGALTAPEVAVNYGFGPNGEPFGDPGTAGAMRLECSDTSLRSDSAETAQVFALVTFSNTSLDVPVNGMPETTWSSDNTDIVTVSASGLVTAVGPGQTLVRAQYGDKSASIQFDAVSIAKPITLVHHWPFDDAPGQTTVVDLVGGANGVVIGTNHAFTGEALDLFGGGTSATAGTTGGSYVDLPNGLVSTLPGAATFEVVYVRDAAGTWQRVFDFGTSGTEDVPGTGGENIFLTAQNGAGVIRVAVATNSPGYDYEVQWDDVEERPAGELVHVVFTYDSDDSVSQLYVNGERVDIANAVFALADIDDVNNWLGRAQYSVDPNFNGKLHDLKIYTGIMLPNQVAANYAALFPAELAIESAALTPAGLVLSWTEEGATAFGVETAGSMAPGEATVWTPTGLTPVEVEGAKQVTIPLEADEGYYRLSE